MRVAEMGMGEGVRVVVGVIRMIVIRGGITIVIIKWVLWKFLAWVRFVEVIGFMIAIFGLNLVTE